MYAVTIIVGAVAALVSGLSMYFLMSGVIGLVGASKARVRGRIRNLGDDAQDISGLPSGTKWLLRSHYATAYGWRQTVARSLSPLAEILDRAGTAADSARLAQAGLGRVLTVEDMPRIRAWFAFSIASGLSIFGLMSGVESAVLFFAFGLVLGIRIPSFILGGAATTRMRECVRGLPEMIDMVSLGSRAGMTFDGALAMYVERFDTPLAHEFGLALQKWRVGAATREEALQGLAASMEVDVIDRFVSAVLQAMKLGTPLAKTLEEQARDARKEQRLILEAEIAKAPVKMFVPLGTLIMPAMLILLLGPVLLQMMDAFSGG